MSATNHTDEYATAEKAFAVVDAKDRAWRTFLQNVGLDLAVVVGPLLYDAVGGWNGSFSAAYWIPVGIMLGKTAALVVIAYVMRLRKPPLAA